MAEKAAAKEPPILMF